MKQSLFIALLGITVSLGAPSLAVADNGHKYNGAKLDQHSHAKHHQRKHKNKHQNKHKRFVAKPPKPHRNHSHKKNNRRFVKNYSHNKHNYVKKRYYHDNKPSFSISWNVGDSTISYGDNKYGYSNEPNYNRHSGKRLYKRLNKQRNRIHRGIQDGRIVNHEASKLRHQQHHIKNTLSLYKRDGHLNRYERSKLHQLLDVANNNINRKINNRLTRHSQQQHHHYSYAQY